MKKLTLTIALILSYFSISAQSVEGSFSINGKSEIGIELKNNYAVDLYATFRNNENPILFQFTANGLSLKDQKKEVVLISFKTMVKLNGKVVGEINRQPIPFFPGDMWMPVETFDFISILSTLQTNDMNNISAMPPGNYEIIIEAQSNKIKGKIQPLTIFFKVN